MIETFCNAEYQVWLLAASSCAAGFILGVIAYHGVSD